MSSDQAPLRRRAIELLPALYEQLDVAEQISTAPIAQRQFALKPQLTADYGGEDDTVKAKRSGTIDLHDIQGDIFPSFSYVFILPFKPRWLTSIPSHFKKES